MIDDPAMTLLFWGLVALVAYAYLGYPLTVAVAGRILRRRVRRERITPHVTVVIAAYNEEDVIVERLRNLLRSDYPSDRLDVVVASDGSGDATVPLARNVDAERVRVLDLPRQGKAAALASGARNATGEILVFSDANTMFHRDAVAKLARNFADPDVGGVAGRTGYHVSDEAESTGHGEDLYWRYDTWLKTLETHTGSTVSAHGGMYAVRRELFRPVEDPAVTDDFAISTAVVDQGKRLVFEPAAIGFEHTMAESRSEFGRRVRLMTRGLRGVLLRRNLLNPFAHGFYSVAFGSRKVLRRLVPLAFPVLLVAGAILAPTGPLYALFTTGALALLALAALGWVLRDTRAGKSPVLYAPLFFVLANTAAILALWNVVKGTRIERWTPQRHEPRSGPAAGVPSTPKA